MDDLLKQGIAAYKAGKRDEARKIFTILVKQTPNDEHAWGRMYDVSNNDQERIHCLKQILRINPGNEKAKQLLDTQYALNGINSAAKSTMATKQITPSNSTSSFNPIPSRTPASVYQPKDEKVIKSSLAKAVAAYIIGTSCVLFGGWWTINAWGNISKSFLLGPILIGFGLYIIGDTLRAVQEIIIKPEKIILVGSFSEEELTHKQISNIRLSSVHQRRGRTVTFVIIYRVLGGAITLNHRLGNPEFLYDTLMNWWEGPSENLYATLERD